MKFALIAVLTACIAAAFAPHKARHGKPGKALNVYRDTQLTAFFNRSNGWIASDGGYSLPLSNGKVLWTFGDSYTNDYDSLTKTVPCLFNVRNSAMLQPLNNWNWRHTPTLLSAAKGSYIKSSTADNLFNWPGTGFQLKDTAYIMCFSMKNVSTGLGFDAAGPDVFAKIKLPGMTIAGYQPLPDCKGISFSVGFIKDEATGFVYAFGQKNKGIERNDIYTARFPASKPDAAWQFWNGKGWSSTYQEALPIGSTPSNSTNICRVKNKYLLFSSELSMGCDQGKRIFVQVSNRLTGPFSKPKAIYTITDTLNGHYPFFYLPIAHPEYVNKKDELLLTYSINGYGNCVNTCVKGRFNPNNYRPRGIRVPLKLIDPAL